MKHRRLIPPEHLCKERSYTALEMELVGVSRPLNLAQQFLVRITK
jgi:hypothetical protein